MDRSIQIQEFKFLENSDYEEFNEDIYKKICKLSFKKYKAYSEIAHSDVNLKFNCQEINCFQYDFETSNLNKLCSENYEGDYFANIVFHDNKISYDFISFEDLFENLIEYKSRYYPIINMIHIPGCNTAHCTVYILDKLKNKAYLIDPNGDVITYYTQYFEDTEVIRFHFHMGIKKIFEQIGYEYVPSLELGLSKSINTENYEVNHKPFFEGYCVAYSFIIADLCIMLENYNKEMKDILNKVYNLQNYQKNNLINRYHSYVHSMVSAIF